MQQNDTLQDWMDYWNAAVASDTERSGDKGEKSWKDDEQVAFWDKMSETYGETEGRPNDWKETIEQVLRLLDDAGFSAPGSTVLDIGCGPGILSIPLARAGAKVTALDVSTGMLNKLQEKAAGENLSVDSLKCSWWTTDIDELGFRKKFDLVIASTTPAIKDLENFDKMAACSKKFCYYSGFLNRGWNRGYEDIYRTILHEEPPDRKSGRAQMSMVYPFMYLYFQGFRPMIRFKHHKWNSRNDPGWDTERAIEMIGRRRNLDEDTREKIREYFKTNPQDRNVHPGPRGMTGMMVWDITDR